MGAKCVLPPPLWSDCVLAGSKGWLAPEHTIGDVLIGRWCRAGHALVCQMPGFLKDDSWAESGNLVLRKLPTELCLLLARPRTLEGESYTLGPCPFLSGQIITFFGKKKKITEMSLPDMT